MQTGIQRPVKSHSTGAFRLQQPRFSTTSITSDEDDNFLDESFEDVNQGARYNIKARRHSGIEGKSRIHNLSCPTKGRPLPNLPMEGYRRGSTDDTFYAYQAKKEKRPSFLTKPVNRDSGRESTTGESLLTRSRNSSRGGLPSPPGESGTPSGDELEEEQPRLTPMVDPHPQRPKSILHQDAATVNMTDHLRQTKVPTSNWETKGDDAQSTTIGSEVIALTANDALRLTLSEPGEVDYRLKEDYGAYQKNLREYLGMCDGPPPGMPPKKRGDSVLSHHPLERKAQEKRMEVPASEEESIERPLTTSSPPSTSAGAQKRYSLAIHLLGTARLAHAFTALIRSLTK